MKLKYYSKVLFNNIIDMETLKIVTDYIETYLFEDIEIYLREYILKLSRETSSIFLNQECAIIIKKYLEKESIKLDKCETFKELCFVIEYVNYKLNDIIYIIQGGTYIKNITVNSIYDILISRQYDFLKNNLQNLEIFHFYNKMCNIFKDNSAIYEIFTYNFIELHLYTNFKIPDKNLLLVYEIHHTMNVMNKILDNFELVNEYVTNIFIDIINNYMVKITNNFSIYEKYNLFLNKKIFDFMHKNCDIFYNLKLIFFNATLTTDNLIDILDGYVLFKKYTESNFIVPDFNNKLKNYLLSDSKHIDLIMDKINNTLIYDPDNAYHLLKLINCILNEKMLEERYIKIFTHLFIKYFNENYINLEVDNILKCFYSNKLINKLKNLYEDYKYSVCRKGSGNINVLVISNVWNIEEDLYQLENIPKDSVIFPYIEKFDYIFRFESPSKKCLWYLNYGNVEIEFMKKDIKMTPIQFIIFDIICSKSYTYNNLFNEIGFKNIIDILLMSKLIIIESDELKVTQNNNFICDICNITCSVESHNVKISDFKFNDLKYLIMPNIINILKKNTLKHLILYEKLNYSIEHIINISIDDFDKILNYMLDMDYIYKNDTEYSIFQ